MSIRVVFPRESLFFLFRCVCVCEKLLVWIRNVAFKPPLTPHGIVMDYSKHAKVANIRKAN